MALIQASQKKKKKGILQVQEEITDGIKWGMNERSCKRKESKR
jgi:hypothetical protein